MTTKTNQIQFPPIEQVTALNVPTDQAAFYLNRASQTLRKWVCLENGPIRPVRINGRLAWKVADLKALVSGEVAA
ncbi:helix-turn-helix domain-containing protein [Methylomonas rhizoryzae]|uniref:helix-turn-helix domain-containing protein n=1 Tax=Methylomonas rhizoryzae TaxID=2608981 RepID=UPI001232AFB6|nr:helix-turn-helix domain-containing protein [Methylomonas rhizoryzae]